MKIYDLSQEVFTSVVFPGDPAPKKETLASLSGGDACNLTAFSMCAHNGTHLDAPYHFIENGRTVENIPLEQVVGEAYLAETSGIVTEADIRAIVAKAKAVSDEAAKRILIKGNAQLSYEGALALVENGVILYGNESQTVGPEDAPMAIHRLLLGQGIVLLEGIRPTDVGEGSYLLVAAPLSLGGADGAPCRAILIAK